MSDEPTTPEEEPDEAEDDGSITLEVQDGVLGAGSDFTNES